MFIFTNFVQKVDFERTQIQKLIVPLAKFYLFLLYSSLVSWKSCFNAPKVLLNKYFTMQMFITASFVQKSGFQQSQFKSTHFSYFSCFQCRYQGKVVLKLQKLCWTNFFATEIFILANFVQKRKFKQLQFKNVGNGTG